MKLVEWWKTSSAKAGAEHYAQRFDANELDDLRAGRLNASAQAKFKARVRSYKKLVSGVLIGCGVPLLVIVFPFAAMLVYGIYTAAGALHRSPIAWIWLGFILLVLGLIIGGYTYVAAKLFAFKRSVAADLNDSRVGIEQGRVEVRIVGARGSVKVEYWMNDAQFPVLGDAIGSEIQRHFQMEPHAAASRRYQTNEIYRFYYLPISKLLLHFEKA